MKKNKGFTLVELLAAIVILGILLVIAAPTILNMIANNKNKMYVDAAKKLISQAEYEMRASSSKIEKPNSGDVIVISLVYLDSSDFETAPENGEYVKEASFVVVKNTGAGLEYSATIVEKMKKGGYKGIELTSNANLLAKDATKYVKGLNKDDIVFVQKNKIGSVLTKAYIDQKLGKNGISYCNSIKEIYNYPDLPPGVSSGDGSEDGVASIKRLSIESASTKDFNSFNAVLSVEVTGDKDTRKDLKVYTSLSSYTDALNTSGSLYGAADIYTKTYDFSSVHNVYDGYEITVYVVVKDKAGNTSRGKINYQLHSNRAPIIDVKNSSIKKLDDDSHNLPKAAFELDVTDDIDDTEDLEVCITPIIGSSCSNYKKYSDYFDSDNVMVYDFGGIPDGRKMGFTVYVRDKNGLSTHADFDYQIYENKAPTISNITITGENDGSISSGSLNANIKLTATDDFPVEDLKVKISSAGVSDVTLDYDELSSDGYSYEFSGTYDGTSRNITFLVTDKYGKTATATRQYQIYKNKPPVIETATVTSDGLACSNTALCPLSAGGATDAFISVKATDDIDRADNYGDLRVCVSLDEAMCDVNYPDNFEEYSYYRDKKIPISFVNENSDGDNPYDGSTKRLYYVVVDSYGEFSKKTFDYKLYKNQAPSNINVSIESTKSAEIDESDFADFLPLNLKTATLKLSASDDWGTDNLLVSVCRKNNSATVEDGEEVIEECDDYKTFEANSMIEFYDDLYTGQDYTVTVNIKDKYGAIGSKSVNYKLYNDKPPVLENFKIESKSTDYSTNEILLSYTVKDALDNFSICLGPSADYNECSSGGYYVSEADEFTNKHEEVKKEVLLPFDYDGESRDIYLVVKDAHNNVISQKVNYTVYGYCRFIDDSSIVVRYYLENSATENEGENTGEENPDTDSGVEAASDEETTGGETPSEGGETPSEGGEEEFTDYISAETCSSKCYRDGDNPLEVKYHRFVEARDLHFGDYDCNSSIEVVTRDCSFHLCYQMDENGNYQAVGIKKIELDWTHEALEDDEEVVDPEEGENEGEIVDSGETGSETGEVGGTTGGEGNETGEVSDGDIGEIEEPGSHWVEHIHTYYYKIYNVVYDPKLDQLTFIETAEKACPDLFDKNYYISANGYVLTKD